MSFIRCNATCNLGVAYGGGLASFGNTLMDGGSLTYCTAESEGTVYGGGVEVMSHRTTLSRVVVTNCHTISTSTSTHGGGVDVRLYSEYAYLPLTTDYFLLTTYYSLHTTYYLLLTTYYLLQALLRVWSEQFTSDRRRRHNWLLLLLDGWLFDWWWSFGAAWNEGDATRRANI